ncbi:MAG: carboxypeptidase-like regulatory domain-containing protein [Bryobacteraceae bacterium]|nr:carboxypeptidase-like regulatory domain-containing protein [Bryobacteraceae bacterium]
MRQLLTALLVTISPALACSCLNTSTPCSVLGGSSVIFVADVIAESGERWGDGSVKVAIVEPIQNVPEGLKEATIATMARTSCYRRLQLGERYVIITQGPAYSVSSCNESFRLKGNEHILDAMRNQLRGAAPRLVGTIRKSSGLYARDGGIANVRVELRNGESRYSGTSDGEGRYVISGLQAARYTVHISKSGYVPDEEYNHRWSGRMALNREMNRVEPVKDAPGEIEILGRSCQIRDLAMWPAGRIRGTLRGVDGRPIAGVNVQAFGFDERGERQSSPLKTGVTDSKGRYSIEPLPSGRYLVGVNAQPYHDESPYRPSVYSDGQPVYLGETATVDDIDLAVGSPRTPVKSESRHPGREAAPGRDGQAGHPSGRSALVLAGENGCQWGTGRTGVCRGELRREGIPLCVGAQLS